MTNPTLLRGTTRTGRELVGELITKKRVAAVDWKEHPIEVMAWLDRLAGKAWKRDAERWAFTESIDLDRCLPDKFLPACAAAFEPLGLSLVSLDRGSDEAIFGVVPSPDVAVTLAEAKKKKAAIALVVPAKTKATAKPKAKDAALASEAATARATLDKRIESARSVDGVVVDSSDILHVARLAMAAGAPVDDVRALLSLAVDNEIDGLAEQRFRQHGPQIEGELIGAALLVGRGHVLARALAHVYSLGERSKTSFYQCFLGRDLPPTWSRRDVGRMDALFEAPKAHFALAARKYLEGEWSTWSRGMKGSRMCLLVMGLAARHGVKLELPPAIEKYVDASLVESAMREATLKLPLRPKPPLPPALPKKLGPARDASRSAEATLEVARGFDGWIRESIAHAVREKSGMYLRAVPESAVDVATSLYAAGASLEEVKAWLGFAVDLEIARREHAWPESASAWGDDFRTIAGAAVLTGKARVLGGAWTKAANLASDPRARAVLDAMVAWLDGRRAPAAPKSPPTKRVAKAILTVLGDRNEAALEAFVRTQGATAAQRPDTPWPGPFDTFVTALAKPMKASPRSAAAHVMEEVLGRAPAPKPALEWPKPRTKLPLESLRGIVFDAIRRIDAEANLIHCAGDCLLVARCVHALGAPAREVASWLHRSVDLAKREWCLDEDLLGAARLVNRAEELSGKIGYADMGEAETAFAEALRAYAEGQKLGPASAKLKQRHFFHPFVAAAIAARAKDLRALHAALGRAPWEHRREWTGDSRKRPPDLSWFVMALCVDAGTVAVPPETMPFVDAEIVNAALGGSLGSRG